MNSPFSYPKRTGSGRRGDSRAPAALSGSGYDPTVYHFLVVGQSLGTGTYDSNAFPDPETLTTRPRSSRHWMFSSGVRCGVSPLVANINVLDTGLSSLVPLYETDLREWATSGTQGHGETEWTSFAFELSKRSGGKTILVSSSNIDGSRYNNIKKGTVPYTNCISQAKAGFVYAQSRGLPYQNHILCVHGEDDASFNVTDYVTNLPAWQVDLQRDLQKISNQTVPVLLFFCQQCDFNPAFQTNTSTCVSNQQYLAWLNNQRLLVLIGPKYQYQMNGDGIHFNPGSSRWHGAQYGKAVYQTLFGKGTFKPLSPIQAVASGSTITLDLLVPVPPLVLDRALVLDTGTVPAGSGASVASRLKALSATVTAGGTNYAPGDTITLAGGTNTVAAVATVATVSGSSVATVTITTGGTYSALPANPVAQASTSGSGTGCTLTVTWGVDSVVVSAAGKNYPSGTTATFSGGGGSGATGTAVLNSSAGLSSVTITAAGTGYTSLPTCTITSPAVVAGFSVSDDSGAAPAVTSVAVASTGTQLTIGLSGSFTGSSKVLRYAWGTTTNSSGSYNGTGRGNVRDSDPEKSDHGCPLYNWLIAFEMAVT